MGTALLEDLTELPQPGLELTEVTEVIRVLRSSTLCARLVYQMSCY